MADPSLTVIRAGTLEKTCFSSKQEELEYFAKAMSVSPDFLTILQGAKGLNGTNGVDGINGTPGPAGAQGIQGPQGDPAAANHKIYPISNGSLFVDIPFLNVNTEYIYVFSKRQLLATVDYPTPYDPATGVVGVGTLINNLATNVTRVYFNFTNCAVVPNGDFELHVSTYKNV